MKYLNLSNNQVTDEGVLLLTLAKWPLLEELKTQNTKVSLDGIEMIVNQSRWHRLKHLNLSDNEISDEGVTKLVRKEWPYLEELYLRNAKITPLGIESLVNKMKLMNLKKLDISGNPILDEGLETLTFGKWPLLQHLVYYNTQVTLKGNIALLESFPWPCLQHLEHSLAESFYGSLSLKLSSPQFQCIITQNLCQ